VWRGAEVSTGDKEEEWPGAITLAGDDNGRKGVT